MCVVTNPHHKHKGDNIYPIHYDPDYWNQSEPGREDVRMVFHTTDNSDYYLPSSSILWIESAGNSRHCVIHTTEGTIEALATTAMIEKQYSDVLLRCHASYLVNPDYIRNIRRFAVTMADGAELPIPEKKYMSFKKRLRDR